MTAVINAIGMWINRHVRNLDNLIHFLFLTSLILYLAIQFLDLERLIAGIIPPILGESQSLSKTMLFIEQVCLALISSWIFYMVVVFLKQQRDRQNISVYAKPKIRDIIEFHRCMLSQMESAIPFYLGYEQYPSKQKLIELFDAYQDARKRGCMLEVPGFYGNQTITWHNLLYKVVPLTDSELVVKLTNIEDCDFMHGKVGAEEFYEYQNHIRNLEKYYREYYAQ